MDLRDRRPACCRSKRRQPIKCGPNPGTCREPDWKTALLRISSSKYAGRFDHALDKSGSRAKWAEICVTSRELCDWWFRSRLVGGEGGFRTRDTVAFRNKIAQKRLAFRPKQSVAVSTWCAIASPEIKPCRVRGSVGPRQCG